MSFENRFHEKLKQQALAYDYYVYPVGDISNVDNERRKLVKNNRLRYISMLSFSTIYLLLFRKKKENEQ